MNTDDVNFIENLFSHYRREGEIERDIKGDSSYEVVAQEITTFLILVGIYFPSVTGTKQKSFFQYPIKNSFSQVSWPDQIVVVIYVIQVEVFHVELLLL
jgi:hypothetical protein